MNILASIAKFMGYVISFILAFALGGAIVYFAQPVLGIEVSMALGVLLFGACLYLAYKLIWRPVKWASLKLLWFLVPFLPVAYSFMSAPFVSLDIPDVVDLAQTTKLTKEMVTLSKGEKMAVYTAPVTNPNAEHPIVFVNGGPGGPITKEIADFLELLASTGYRTYTFDYYASGSSELANPDPALLTIKDEARRLYEIVKHVSPDEKVHLIGSSYAGALIGRYLVDHADVTASFVAMDTSPLYDLSNGNVATKMILNEEYGRLQQAADRAEEARAAAGGSGEDEVSLNPVTAFKDRVMPRISSFPGLIRALSFFWGLPKDEVIMLKPNEASFILEKFLTSTEEEKPYVGLSFMAQNINKDIAKSPDYYESLIAQNTPPVLVVHPQEGLVPWFVHKDYESFFDQVTFLPWKDAGHGVWKTRPEALVAGLQAFFAGQPVPGAYTGLEDPFKSQ